MTFLPASRYLIPASSSNIQKLIALPSMTGISFASTEILILSMPYPFTAAIRCSIVLIKPFSLPTTVAICVFITFLGSALKLIPRSSRCKIIPEFASRGSSISLIGSPL